MKRMFILVFSLILSLQFIGCSSVQEKNEAKEAAVRYWQSKAYPGKSFDVQVIDAEHVGDNRYRVKGVVDGETRVGVYSRDSETFSEGFYALAQERNKRVAELEEAVEYWKSKSEQLEKENYKLTVEIENLKQRVGQ